jgi:hypothetical protein
MVKLNCKLHLKIAVSLAFLAMSLSCNTPPNREVSKDSTSNTSTKLENITLIPDAVIQFLIYSAARDFKDHHPPTAIDIRNVKAGFIPSGKDTMYLICGEFLSKEENNWIQFVTIKTSGYEQYIGDNMYCQKATFEKTDNGKLSDGIKQKLDALEKLRVPPRDGTKASKAFN